MFIKIYKYHIKEDKEEAFLAIQEKVVSIYQAYINCEVMFLKSLQDETMWLEISRYFSKDDYLNGVQKINENPAIQSLFKKFESCLVSEVSDIEEQHFLLKLRILTGE